MGIIIDMSILQFWQLETKKLLQIVALNISEDLRQWKKEIDRFRDSKIGIWILKVWQLETQTFSNRSAEQVVRSRAVEKEVQWMDFGILKLKFEIWIVTLGD